MVDDVRTRVVDSAYVRRQHVRAVNEGHPATIGFLRRVHARVAVGVVALQRDLDHARAIAAFPTPPPSPPFEEVDPWRDSALRHGVNEEEDEPPAVAGKSIYGGVYGSSYARDCRMPFYEEPGYRGIGLWDSPFDDSEEADDDGGFHADGRRIHNLYLTRTAVPP